LPDGKASVSNVLEFAKDTETWHPTQKPLALIAHLIRQYSNPGDTVLDTCMGSATTAVAAIRTGRNWIGYEMNEKFYKQAQKRIEHALISPTLF
jgi:site-specific DNA-methyltransferase (adenine-specific)